MPIPVDITAIALLTVFSRGVIFPLMPRFIISVRELYDRDLRSRWEGIDSGFGVLSQPVFSRNAVVSVIASAGVNFGQEQGQVVEDDAVEVLGNGTGRVVVAEGENSQSIRVEDRACRV